MGKYIKKLSVLVFIMLLIVLVTTACSSDIGKNNGDLIDNMVDIENQDKFDVETKTENRNKDTEETAKKGLDSDSDMPAGNKKLRVHFLDVGQGDCILIQTPNNKTMLIDAGNKEDYNVINNYIKNLDIKKLDVLVATHPHADHIGSMAEIVSNHEIGDIYMPEVMHNTRTFENLMLAIEKKGLQIKSPVAGSFIDLDKDLEIQILGPVSSNYESLNNYSIVNKITYKSNSFLFTGDAEKMAEDEMIAEGYNLKIDVLKVGHHGSTTSTSPAFVSAVKPKYSVIMAGRDNPYGHPDSIILNRLRLVGSEVFRTDLDGTIVMISDGNKINVETIGSTAQQTEPSNNVEKQKLIKGNKNSMIYHVLGGAYYDKTTSNIEWFATEEEAEKAGYRKSKR